MKLQSIMLLGFVPTCALWTAKVFDSEVCKNFFSSFERVLTLCFFDFRLIAKWCMENIREIILQKLYAQCPVHFDFSHIFFAFCSVGLVGGSDRAKPMSSEAAQPLARLAKVGREAWDSES